ncbi:sodium:proton antiporter [Cryobacterium lactosi]|uniref:Sodium:proton antiporter n=1 Tax=Cryobacterium lactosi TaxID=1259202 RepID=A0A4R9BGU8_9MICO|nr:sodium:proton antiporter [Cryobacterium lactosi]TFD83528.1 sodium:proton antiporter [Cryobacterium lactosi]
MSKLTRGTALGTLIALIAGGLIFYIVTSTTGYLVGSVIDPLPIVLTAIAILLLGAEIWLGGRIRPFLRDLALIASIALLALSFATFLLARVPLAGDVYFIPVNYPEAEAVTLHLSFVGLGLYAVAIVVLTVAAFSAKRTSRLPQPIVVN